MHFRLLTSLKGLNNFTRFLLVNPLECKGNYNTTSNNMKLAADGWAFGTARRDWRRRQHSPLLAVPITVLLYDGPLLCGFNVPIKGLKSVKLV